MSEGLEGCAVCGGRAILGTRMSKVVVEGRALELCRAHASTVVAAMPETFEDLRALFVGAGVDLHEHALRGRSGARPSTAESRRIAGSSRPGPRVGDAAAGGARAIRTIDGVSRGERAPEPRQGFRPGQAPA
jgi:hypothetical protein